MRASGKQEGGSSSMVSSLALAFKFFKFLFFNSSFKFLGRSSLDLKYARIILLTCFYGKNWLYFEKLMRKVI